MARAVVVNSADDKHPSAQAAKRSDALRTMSSSGGADAHGQKHPLFGELKGAVYAPPGVDLTELADPDWGAIAGYPDTLPSEE